LAHRQLPPVLLMAFGVEAKKLIKLFQDNCRHFI
jgi:hypothetical protein